MKKSILYLLLVAFAVTTLASCGAKKKGCGLTSDNIKVPQQEIVVADNSH